MPKMKTSKTAAKRFKLTGTGKLPAPVVWTEVLMFTPET